MAPTPLDAGGAPADTTRSPTFRTRDAQIVHPLLAFGILVVLVLVGLCGFECLKPFIVRRRARRRFERTFRFPAPCKCEAT